MEPKIWCIEGFVGRDRMHGCGRILSRQYASAFGRKMGRDRIPQAI
jgi:hypothetical protein